jgi:hypothetical protein
MSFDNLNGKVLLPLFATCAVNQTQRAKSRLCLMMFYTYNSNKRNAFCAVRMWRQRFDVVFALIAR